jgi:hypothetical protein
MFYRKIMATYSVFLLIVIAISPFLSTESKADPGPPIVKINIDPYSIIYEGDIIDCEITGIPNIKYWTINNQSKHTTFYENNPVIFDPEPTPLDQDYVTLTVYVENDAGNASDSVQVIIKRIYFGDIHWHTTLGDGKKEIDEMYKNAIADRYLDFAASSETKLLNIMILGILQHC